MHILPTIAAATPSTSTSPTTSSSGPTAADVVVVLAADEDAEIDADVLAVAPVVVARAC
jgi:hypothetical protein